MERSNAVRFFSKEEEYQYVYKLLQEYREMGEINAVNILELRLQALAKALAPKVVEGTRFRGAPRERVYKIRIPIILQSRRARYDRA